MKTKQNKMRTQLLSALTAVILLLMPNINFGQTAPTLGTTSGFALFTAGGAFSTNSEAGTIVTGDVGNHTGANSAFPPGTLNGTAHWLDGLATTAATDVATAYTDLNQGGSVISVTLGGQTLSPGVYFTGTGTAAALSGTLTLDGGGNQNAIFIIRVDGALTIATSSSINLINSASLCNVYWQVNGQFDLGAGSVFRGTLINNGAINLLEGSSLFGRGLSTAGAINLYNNIVTIGSPSAAAGTITGTATVCQGQTGVAYSVPTITNATSYIWTLPAGATITAGANTNSITVSFSNVAASGNMTVQGNSSCGTGAASANFSITVNPLPTTAGTITGTATVCTGQTGVAYSVPTITNATSYIWTLPAGATITAGATTNSITVSFSNTAASGNMTVQGSGSCGTGAVSTNFAITVNSLPAAAGTITGTTTVCQGQTVVAYSVPTITNATSYIWTLPAGATITAGANTNSITVSFSNIAASGNMTVQGSSSCGIGVVSANFAVTVNSLPAAAGTITGTATVCQGQTGVAYSVPTITNATSYIWTLPAGATITAGAGTNSITVTFSASAVSGNITVRGSGSCGTGVVSTNFAVTVNHLPTTAGTIIGTATICQGQTGVTYSVPTITNATSYIWTLPAGATITAGANTNSITVSFSNVAASGNITVQGSSSCGTGLVSANFAVTVNIAPIIINGPVNQTVCAGSSANFSVTATGTGLTYQWRKGTVNLINGGNISGATSPMLSINSVTISNAASNYNVVIAGTCSPNVTSANVSLTINTAPHITLEPHSQMAPDGNSQSFSVGATGAGLTYQWRKGSVNLINGGNISGATSATLTINPVSIADTADYSVVVSGICLPNDTSIYASLFVCVCTGSGIATIGSGNTNDMATIYPNPFKTSLEMKINDNSQIDKAEVEISNVLGVVVISTIITKQITTVETSNLPSGNYIYKVISNNKVVQSGKLISQ